MLAFGLWPSPARTDDPIGKSTRRPRLEIVPSRALFDEKVSIRLRGVEPNQRITLRARLKDRSNALWESHADFVADEKGVVDVDTRKPVSGTYSEVDGAGLFWSMSPVPDLKEVSPFDPLDASAMASTPVIITAEIAGNALVSETLERMFAGPDVIRIPVRREDLAGTFFRPRRPGRYPGIIVMGGSRGGLQEQRAALLASHRYATLALAYFNFEHLPPKLVDIPLEYFATAIRWMRSQDAVSDKLGVMGASRGGELALLLGATFQQIKAVISYAPSSVVWPGLSPDGSSRASWTYEGIPLPYMRNPTLEEAARVPNREPVSTTPLALITLADAEAVASAAIPVERINGPVLLISGNDDQLWPSSVMSEMVMKRLAERGHPFEDEHFDYKGTGHGIPVPNAPTTTVSQSFLPAAKRVIAYGGNARQTALAASDSWSRVLAFLEVNLK